MLISNAD